MRKELILRGLAIVFTLVFIYPISLYANDSRMFGINLQRDRVSGDPLPLPVKEVWSTTVADLKYQLPIMGQPVVLEEFNRVFLKAGRYLVALDLRTGQEVGRQLLEINGDTFPSVSSITFSDNQLFVGTRSSGVLAFPVNFAYEYSRLWHFPLTSKVSSSPLVVEDKVIFGSTNRNLYMLNRQDGKNLETPSGRNMSPIIQDGEVTSSPTLINGHFYLGVDNSYTYGYVRGYDLTGKLTFEYLTSSGVPASIASDGESLYLSDKLGRFLSLDIDSQQANWINNNSAYANNTFINNSPALFKDKVYFVVNDFKGTAKAKVFAHDKERGIKKWEASLSSTSIVAPIVWENNNLLIAGDDEGNVYAFDVDTGRPVPWYYDSNSKQTISVLKLPGAICGEFAIAGGRLLISTADGKIRAFGQDGMINLQAVSMTAGVEKAKANSRYLGAARFSINSLAEPVKAPVRIYLDSELIYEREVVLPEGTHTSVRVSFPWQTPSTPKSNYELRATINEDKSAKLLRNDQTLEELNYQDNTLKLNVPSDILNLELVEITAPSSVEVGKSYSAMIKVKNHSDARVKTWVKLYRNQAEIGKQEIDIAANETKEVRFTWRSPSSSGDLVLKGIVNPDRLLRETNYEDNTRTKRVDVVAEEVNRSGGKLILTARSSPTKVKAGYGFAITANTSTLNYEIEYTEPVVDRFGNVQLVKKSRSEACPGPKRVTAKFPDGEIIELQPLNPTSNASNTWQLPFDPKVKDRQHLVPVETPNGKYKVIVTAHEAGKNGEFTASKTIIVDIEGSIYDDFHSRITR